MDEKIDSAMHQGNAKSAIEQMQGAIAFARKSKYPDSLLFHLRIKQASMQMAKAEADFRARLVNATKLDRESGLHNLARLLREEKRPVEAEKMRLELQKLKGWL